MSVARDLPPEVFVPASARPRLLRSVGSRASSGDDRLDARTPESFWPAAPAAAATGALVIDLDRWRHHLPEVAADDRHARGAGSQVDDWSAQSKPGQASRSDRVVAPVRLTRRGIAVLLAAATLIAVALVAIAGWSAPSSTRPPVRAASGSAVVTVQAGDSLWVIAQRVAPTRDPRDEVAQLRKLNHLTSDTVDPGQSLRVR